MKTNNFLTITSVALATATLTVLANWGGSLDAGNDTDQVTPKIATPRLVCDGVELTLVPKDGRKFNAGDRPEFEFKAVNTTAKPVTLSIGVALTSTPEISRLSRMVPTSTMMWYDPQSFTLAPNETRVRALTANTNLPAGRMFTVTLQQADPLFRPVPGAPAPSLFLNRAATGLPMVVALSFSTVVQKPAGESAPIVALAQ